MRVTHTKCELSYRLEPKVYGYLNVWRVVSNGEPNATSMIRMAIVHERIVCAMNDVPTTDRSMNDCPTTDRSTTDRSTTDRSTTDRSTTENFLVFVLGVGTYDVVARRYDTNAGCTVLSNVRCLDSLYTAMPFLRVEGVLWLIWL